LIGSKEFINHAIRIRKVLGGGMRQAGYLASCGIYALKYNIKRLREDHLKAKEIESVLKKLNFVSKVEPVETNILIFQLKKFINPNLFIDNMFKNDVKLISMGDNKLRLVTHKDYTNEMHDKFLDILINLKF
jgi:threonine aldolase